MNVDYSFNFMKWLGYHVMKVSECLNQHKNQQKSTTLKKMCPIVKSVSCCEVSEAVGEALDKSAAWGVISS